MRERLQKELPKVTVTTLEGTYLTWIDLSKYLSNSELKSFIQGKCKMAVDYGNWFGSAGAGFIRLNLACPRKWVVKAVDNIIKELGNIK